MSFTSSPEFQSGEKYTVELRWTRFSRGRSSVAFSEGSVLWMLQILEFQGYVYLNV